MWVSHMGVRVTSTWAITHLPSPGHQWAAGLETKQPSRCSDLRWMWDVGVTVSSLAYAPDNPLHHTFIYLFNFTAAVIFLEMSGSSGNTRITPPTGQLSGSHDTSL